MEPGREQSKLDLYFAAPLFFPKEHKIEPIIPATIGDHGTPVMS
jgi:hypothetical protein